MFTCMLKDSCDPAQNRNFAYAQTDSSLSEHISNFDVDDIMHPQRIEILQSLFDLFPHVDVFYHNFYMNTQCEW